MEIYNLNLCGMLSQYLQDNGIREPESITRDTPGSLSYLLENAFRKLAVQTGTRSVIVTGCNTDPNVAFNYKSMEL